MTTALTDLIARVLNREGWTCCTGAHEPGDYDKCEACQHVALDVSAAVMSVVAPAIQAAKAEALREAADDIDFDLGRGYTGADDRDATAAAEVWLRDRAEQIEKEDPR